MRRGRHTAARLRKVPQARHLPLESRISNNSNDSQDVNSHQKTSNKRSGVGVNISSEPGASLEQLQEQEKAVISEMQGIRDDETIPEDEASAMLSGLEKELISLKGVVVAEGNTSRAPQQTNQTQNRSLPKTPRRRIQRQLQNRNNRIAQEAANSPNDKSQIQNSSPTHTSYLTSRQRSVQNNDQNSQVEQLRKRLLDVESNYKQEVGELQKQVSEVNGSLFECENVIVEQEELIEKKHAIIRDLEDKLSSATRKAEELRVQVRRLRIPSEPSKDLMKEMDELKEHLDAALEEKKLALAKLKAANNSKKRITESSEQMSKKLADAHEVENELRQMIEDQNKALESLKDELSSILYEKEDMENEFSKTIDEKDATIESMKEEVLATTNEKGDIQKKLEEKDTAFNSLKEKLASIMSLNEDDDEESEVSANNNDEDASDDSLPEASLSIRVEQLSNLCSFFAGSVVKTRKSMKEEIVKFNAIISALKKEALRVLDLETQLAESKTGFDALKAEFDSAQDENAASVRAMQRVMAEQNNTRDEEMEQLKEEIKGLKLQNEELNNKIDALVAQKKTVDLVKTQPMTLAGFAQSQAFVSLIPDESDQKESETKDRGKEVELLHEENESLKQKIEALELNKTLNESSFAGESNIDEKYELLQNENDFLKQKIEALHAQNMAELDENDAEIELLHQENESLRTKQKEMEDHINSLLNRGGSSQDNEINSNIRSSEKSITTDSLIKKTTDEQRSDVCSLAVNESNENALKSRIASLEMEKDANEKDARREIALLREANDDLMRKLEASLKISENKMNNLKDKSDGSMTNEIVTLRDTNRSLQERIDYLTTERSSEEENFREEAEILREENDGLRQLIEDMQIEKNSDDRSSNEEIEMLRDENEDLKHKLDEIEFGSEKKSVREEIKLLRHENKQIKAEVEKVRKDRKRERITMDEEIEVLRVENENLIKEMEAAEKARQDNEKALNDEIDFFIDENDDLKLQVEQLQTANGTGGKEPEKMKHLLEENKIFREKIDAMELDRAAEGKKYAEKMQLLHDEIHELKNKVQIVQMEKAAEIQITKGEIQFIRDESDGMKQQIKTLIANEKASEKEIESLRGVNKKLQEQVETSVGGNTDDENETIGLLRIENDIMKQKIDTMLKQKIDTMQMEIITKKKKDSELESLRKENEGLENKIKDLTGNLKVALSADDRSISFTRSVDDMDANSICDDMSLQTSKSFQHDVPTEIRSNDAASGARRVDPMKALHDRNRKRKNKSTIENQQLRAEIEELRKKNKMLTEENVKLREKNENIISSNRQQHINSAVHGPELVVTVNKDSSGVRNLGELEETDGSVTADIHANHLEEVNELKRELHESSKREEKLVKEMQELQDSMKHAENFTNCQSASAVVMNSGDSAGDGTILDENNPSQLKHHDELQEISRLKEEVKSANNLLQDKDEEIRTIQQEQNILRIELASTKDFLKSQSEDLRKANTKNKNLEDEIESSRTLLQTQSDETRNMQIRHDDLESEVELLRNNLDDANQNSNALKAQLDDEMKNSVAEKEAILQVLSTKEQALEKANKLIGILQKSRVESLSCLRNDLKEKEAEIKSLFIESDEDERKLTTLKYEKDLLEKFISANKVKPDVKSQVSDLQQSTSSMQEMSCDEKSDSQNQVNSETNDLIDRLESENRRMSSELEKLTEEKDFIVNEKDAALDSLRQDLEEIKMELELVIESKNKELEECQRKIAVLEDQTESETSRNKNNTDDKFVHLSQQLEETIAEKDSLKKELKSQVDSLNNAKMIISSLEKANRKMMDDFKQKKLSNSGDVHKEKILEKDRKISKLKVEIKDLFNIKEHDARKHLAELAELRDDAIGKACKIAVLEREIRSLKGQQSIKHENKSSLDDEKIKSKLIGDSEDELEVGLAPEARLVPSDILLEDSDSDSIYDEVQLVNQYIKKIGAEDGSYKPYQQKCDEGSI